MEMVESASLVLGKLVLLLNNFNVTFNVYLPEWNLAKCPGDVFWQFKSMQKNVNALANMPMQNKSR